MRGSIVDKTVSVTGSREAVICVLNRALRWVASGNFMIADDDSIDTINGKIQAANEQMAGLQTGFTLMDYLDDAGRMDSPFKDYVLSYIDEEKPDGSENYDANPFDVSVAGEEYTLRIRSIVQEGQRTYLPEDWNYWYGMISVSDGCLIESTYNND